MITRQVDLGDEDFIYELENDIIEHNITHIINCAANKHVYIVEKNIIRSIKINTLCVYKIVKLCNKYKIKNFICIDTDKSNYP